MNSRSFGIAHVPMAGRKRATMIVIGDEHVDLSTAYGPMRTHIVRPAAPGKYPGIVFFTEIFQVTEPIRRTAAMLAGHGYIVAIPEIYHEFEPAGTQLAYDQAGADRGNVLKTTKELASFDADARAVLDHLKSRPDCTGQLGAVGICIGGHLAFRAAMNPDVRGAACFYATDIHKGSLGKGMKDDSLQRAQDIKGELLMIWGRQDPHIPLEGRMKVLARLNDVNAKFSWHEVNGAHAFMRDEGVRYDPELAYQLYGLVFDFFHRRLGYGDLPTQVAGAGETKH
jgi:carboxymethylenebutenolidase